MRNFGILMASALFVAAVGCGSDSGGSAKQDAANGSVDGAVTPGVDSGKNPGVDGPVTVLDAPIGDTAIPGPDAPSVDVGPALDTAVGIDAGTVNPVVDGGNAIDGGTGTCVMPSCMSNGTQTCAPSGACVAQTSTAVTSSCYENHVKVVQQGALTDAAGMSVSFKNDAGICFSLVVDVLALSKSPLVLPVKNAAGTQVATLSIDLTTMQTSVTCQGAQPVALSPVCVAPLLSFIPGSSAATCTQGTCAP
jgi:hypothetical protein